MGMDFSFRFFAGVPMDEMDLFPLLPLGRWLLPVGIYLLLIGAYLGMERKNRRFALVRYGSLGKWWKHYFFKNMAYGALVSIMLYAFAELADLLSPQHLPGGLGERLSIFLLWASHAMVFLALSLFSEVTKMRNMAASAILLFEGMTFLYGCRHKEIARWMFGTWGMYAQSQLYDRIYGFPILYVMAIQVICIAGCYLAGRRSLKRNRAQKTETSCSF